MYEVDLALDNYRLSGGRTFSNLVDTIVRIDTDAGVSGWGEACPFGSNYDQSFAGGVSAGVTLLAPAILGVDPREPARSSGIMAATLKGHGYAKAGLDMACWDLYARILEQPLFRLFGGRLTERVRINSSTPVDEPQIMGEKLRASREAGLRLHSVKMSGDVRGDIERIRSVAPLMSDDDVFTVDCNGGWRVHEALRVANAVADIDVYLEQPCPGYEECRTVRRKTNLPLIMDESAVSYEALVRAQQDATFDVVKFKMSRFGGLSGARKARDFCVEMGLPVWIQDTGGAELTTSAIAHLCHSTPPELLFGGFWHANFVDKRTASGGALRDGGFMVAPDEPGLGVSPDCDVLGDPVAVFH